MIKKVIYLYACHMTPRLPIRMNLTPPRTPKFISSSCFGHWLSVSKIHTFTYTRKTLPSVQMGNRKTEPTHPALRKERCRCCNNKKFRYSTQDGAACHALVQNKSKGSGCIDSAISHLIHARLNIDCFLIRMLCLHNERFITYL